MEITCSGLQVRVLRYHASKDLLSIALGQLFPCDTERQKENVGWHGSPKFGFAPATRHARLKVRIIFSDRRRV